MSTSEAAALEMLHAAAAAAPRAARVELEFGAAKRAARLITGRVAWLAKDSVLHREKVRSVL